MHLLKPRCLHVALAAIHAPEKLQMGLMSKSALGLGLGDLT